MDWLPPTEWFAEAGLLAGRFAPKELFAPPERFIDWLAGTERPAGLDRLIEGLAERFWLIERLEAWECSAEPDWLMLWLLPSERLVEFEWLGVVERPVELERVVEALRAAGRLAVFEWLLEAGRPVEVG